MKKVLSIVALLLSSHLLAVELGKVPSTVILDGKNGSKLDGSAWKSSMLKGKVYILFYVDPDKRDVNNALADALKAKNFDRKKYTPVAVINLAASWLPNAILEAKLKEKQKKFPDTLYVKDKKKVLVKEWNLADDNSDILIFDKKGKVIYQKFGKVSDTEIPQVIALIQKHL
ncbi:YtfJ family protein [Sulfurovum sp.]|uniref:YtfJ family protein n=1 Tax=Sulfurovum sp. TaxID=1969726 RepID=UPI0025DA1D63|nr:YtfJ family protein [Sulfurovum sp.]